MQTYKEILVEAKEEIKVIWKDAWDEYKFTCAKIEAERQIEKHQKSVDLLAIEAQLAIDELKVNHNENFWR